MRYADLYYAVSAAVRANINHACKDCIPRLSITLKTAMQHCNAVMHWHNLRTTFLLLHARSEAADDKYIHDTEADLHVT